MRETEILREIHAALGSRPDVRIWRVNVGVAYPMTAVRGVIAAVLEGKWSRAVELARMAHPIQYGLPGMADLMGIWNPSGRLISLEVKSESGRASKEQLAWAAMVQKFGGVAAVVRSVDEAERALA